MPQQPSVALITGRRPRPCVAPLPTVGAVWAGVWSSTLQTLVRVPTGVARLATLALIIPPTALHGLGSGTRWSLGMALCVVVTAKPRAAGVTWARLYRVILLEAKRAPEDGSGVTSECLVVEAEVWYRPVQVLNGECLPSVAPVVGDPASAFKVSLCPHNRGLICQQLECFLWEACRQ